MTVSEIAKEANSAALILAHLSTELKNQALNKMADNLEANCDSILTANQKDLEFANKEGIAKPLIARLTLNEDKIRGMAQGIRSVVALADPSGVRKSSMELDKDLTLYQVSCPIGVIGAIFESRPDAVPQISSLCLKSGNAVILKGGREAQNSNKVIVELLQEGIKKVAGVPETAVQMIETREEVQDMLKEEKNINLIVPRGSNEFVKYIQDNTKIPVLGHSEGICHNYIDKEADIEKAIRIALDSKLQYPAACNAMENLLVHQGIASKIIPELVKKFEEKGVSLLGCQKTCEIVAKLPSASESEWDEEYNDLKLSIKIVEGVDEAISFINCHGSGHTDTIITENSETAEKFMDGVNSASVMCNASTRFADGFRYGLGAEIGISTNKTHARGPVGLEGLVIYKYRVYGNGQVVSDYSGENARSFTHKPI
ncbi:MAG: glutamate-5-semialdehyde dehydrogenase [Nitrospina sp.]|jgi:glutamate-5-semialdehyde dehydrogenase|nr:glutamate-5-semialdehyde dehydrogenase [Nitrospina sp.]